MKAFVIGLIIASMSASPALAQCGTSYRSRAYSYSSYSYAPTYYAAPSYSTYVEPAKKVVTEYVYQAYIPVFQIEVRAQKTYGAVYLPPTPEPAAQPNPQPQAAPAQPNGGQSAEMKQVLDAIRRIDDGMRAMDQRIRELDVRTRAAPRAAPKKDEEEPPRKEDAKLEIPSVHVVAKNNCAACHDAKLEDAAAASLVVTRDDRLAKLSDKDKTRILIKLAKNKMCSGAVKLGLKPLTHPEYVAFVQAIGDDEKEDRKKGG